MTNFTAEQVLKALSEKFPSDEILYEEIGWKFYDDEDSQGTKSQHIKKFLEENEYSTLEDLLDWSELGYELKGTTEQLVINGESVNVTCVQQLGGMDKGTKANITFKVGDQFFTKEGWYQSHYGYEYDGDFYESSPTEVVTYKYSRK